MMDPVSVITFNIAKVSLIYFRWSSPVAICEGYCLLEEGMTVQLYNEEFNL